MLNLYSYLTEEDNKKIENYITTFGVESGYVGNEKYLKYWAENKKKLFRLLGGNLIYKVPYIYNKPESMLHKEIGELLDEEFFQHLDTACYAKFNELKELFPAIEAENLSYNSLASIWCYSCLCGNKYNKRFEITNPETKRRLCLQPEMKPMRAIQKVIKFFDLGEEIEKEYEDIRIKHSMIFNEKEIKGNLCFSIHPLDFLTMSDNNSWSSCMSWQDNGCYHIGTVEMMNSNNVICVYLDSKTPFVFGSDPKDGTIDNYTWNNKKWRQLFYCTKEIIVSGKAYPYQNEGFTNDALKILRELAEKNCKREYQYGVEEYQDMKHITSKYRMDTNRDWIHGYLGGAQKKNIIFDTKGMYNDMLNDHNTKYWCVRNKVKKNTIISYSGKAPCLCCMSSVLSENDDLYPDDENAYNERYNGVGKVLCWECLENKYCSICGNNNGKHTVYEIDGKRFCSKCVDDYLRICPDCGKVFSTCLSTIKIPHIRLVSKNTEIFSRNIANINTTMADILKDNKLTIPLLSCEDCRKEKEQDFEDVIVYINEKAKEEAGWKMWNRSTYSITKKSYCLKDDFVQRHLPENLQKVDKKDLIEIF